MPPPPCDSHLRLLVSITFPLESRQGLQILLSSIFMWSCPISEHLFVVACRTKPSARSEQWNHVMCLRKDTVLA